jgi:ectoine hydroxylase-related dioxygenase (phytanoyl-CoA dioxygenase family)
VVFGWHTDEREQIPCATADTPEYVSFWIPLDDIDVGSGGLEVSTLADQSDHSDISTGPLLLTAGDAVVFSSKLWHSSGPNSMDRIRRVYYIQVYTMSTYHSHGAFVSKSNSVFYYHPLYIPLSLSTSHLTTVQCTAYTWSFFRFTVMFCHTDVTLAEAVLMPSA